VTNGNGQFPGDVGAGDGTNTDEADALQASIDAELGAMAQDLDALLETVMLPANAELAAMDADAIEIRTAINGAVGDALAVMNGEADALRDRIMAPLTAEIDTGFADMAAVQDQVRPFMRSGDDRNGGVERQERGAPEKCELAPGVFGIVWKGLGRYGSLEIRHERSRFNFLLDDLSIFDSDRFSGFPFQAQIEWDDLAAEPPRGGTGFVYLRDSDFARDGKPGLGPGCILLEPGAVISQPEPTPEVSEPEPLPPSEVSQPAPGVPRPSVQGAAGPTRGKPCPIVALDCESRLLLVIDEAELADNDKLEKVGECGEGEEFDLRRLLATCDVAETAEEGRTLGVAPLVLGRALSPKVDSDCRLPTNLIHPDVSMPVWTFRSVENSIVGSAIKGATQRVPGLIGAPITEIGALNDLEFWIGQSIKIRNQWSDKCADPQKWIESANERALLMRLNMTVPGLFDEAITAADQQAKEECPKRIPTPAEATQAYLANTVSHAQAMCWIRANGFSNAEWERVLSASRAKPGLLDLIGMLRRKIIDPQRFRQQAREDGWTRPQDVENIVKLTVAVPGETDLVRFMQRDVDDPAVVQKFGLDDGFQAKFGAQIKEWSESQGVPEEVMRFHWRAHFEIPGNTALFAMLHRVGRDPDGTIQPEWRDNIETALKVNDVLPFFVDPLLKISFRLPRKAELSAAFRVGELDEAQVMHEFVKRGMETPIARALTRTEVLNKRKAFRSNVLVGQYAKGNINGDDLIDELVKLGADAESAQNALDFGKLRLRMNRRDKCLDAVRHRVLIGEIDRQEANLEAMQITADQDQADALTETWMCERAARSKTSTAAELCSFFKDLIITVPTFLRSLIRIGVPPDRADSLVRRCQIQLDEKELKDRERMNARERGDRNRRDADRKKERAEADKLVAETVAADRKRQSERKSSAAQVSQRAAALRRAGEVRDRNEQLKIAAAKAIAKRNELPYQEVLAWVITIISQARRDNLAGVTEIAKTAKAVSSIKSVTGRDSFERELRRTLIRINA